MKKLLLALLLASGVAHAASFGGSGPAFNGIGTGGSGSVTPGGSPGDIQTNVGGTSLGGITPGTGVATFLATPTSANLAAALPDETGTGLAVFGTAPTLTAPNVTVQAGAVTTTPTWNMALGNLVTLALSGGNITTVTVTNPPTGGSVAFKITQDTSARTIAWPAGNGTSTVKVRWPSGVAPTLSPGSGAIDMVSCNAFSQFLWDCVWQGNFQ